MPTSTATRTWCAIIALVNDLIQAVMITIYDHIVKIQADPGFKLGLIVNVIELNSVLKTPH